MRSIEFVEKTENDFSETLANLEVLTSSEIGAIDVFKVKDKEGKEIIMVSSRYGGHLIIS